MKREDKKQRVIVIGAGLAGLSLACELVDEGLGVVVIEKSKYLGGRASSIIDPKMHDPVPVGPHIFLAAYHNFEKFLKKIGAPETISWERRLFLDMIYRGQHQQFRLKDLPGKYNSIFRMFHYHWLTSAELLSNIRFITHVIFSSQQKLEKVDGISAYTYLRKFGVKKGAIDRMWRFFVLSMLNVPLELCSATELCLLIKFWASLKRKNIGFSKVGLGDIYTDAAEQYLKKRGGRILRQTRIEKILFSRNKVKGLTVNDRKRREKLAADFYISTLNPVDLRGILPKNILSSGFFRGLNAFEGVHYISVNLWFDQKITQKKFWALLSDGETVRYMNTDFYDQSNIYKNRKKPSFITSNIIYSNPYDKLSDQEIVQKTLVELKEAFPRMHGKLVHYHVHHIPYAIYAPYPGLRQHKLSHQTPFSNFFLAGDWTVRDETQCMEAAVRSGYRCAEEIFRSIGRPKKICLEKIE